jgi:hypothetical protein
MNDAIGYTNDGHVFFLVNIKAPDGSVLTAPLTWTPKDALRIADGIKKAALRAKAKKGD